MIVHQIETRHIASKHVVYTVRSSKMCMKPVKYISTYFSKSFLGFVGSETCDFKRKAVRRQ